MFAFLDVVTPHGAFAVIADCEYTKPPAYVQTNMGVTKTYSVPL